MNLQQNLVEIRYLLDEPAEGSPSDRILWSILNNTIANHQAQIQNTAGQWSVGNWDLVTAAGQEDYLVTASNFGKPFWVHTESPNYPQLARVEIPIAMIQNADMFYGGPRQPYASSSDLFGAVVCSFYRTSDGSWYARITPVPGGSVIYKIWFETTPGGPFALGDSPGLTPFHHLIRVQTAYAALSYCGWGDVRSDASDPKKAQAWERKVKALKDISLGPQAAAYEKQFETYIGTLSEAGVERRQAFGENYLNSTEAWNTGFFGPNQFSR